jgi:hypothetical protein
MFNSTLEQINYTSDFHEACFKGEKKIYFIIQDGFKVVNEIF